MKYSILIFIYVLIPFFYLYSYEKENPDSSQFYSALEYNGSDDDIIIKYNMAFSEYSYTLNKVIIASDSNKILSIYFDKDLSYSTKLSIKNLTLSNFNTIKFYLGHKCQIYFEDCTFKDNGCIRLYFESTDRLYIDPSYPTKITLNNCTFDKKNFISSDYSGFTLLKFLMDPSPVDIEKDFSLKFVSLNNCIFDVLRSPSANYRESGFTAIYFYRDNSNVSYSDIEISNCRFYLNTSTDYNPSCIVFENYVNNIFRDESLYLLNKNLTLKDNFMDTNADHSSFGIFVQGPYDSVEVSGNEIYNFARHMINDSYIFSSAILTLYGARSYTTGHYSNNVKNAIIINNTIKTKSSGISITGGINAEIKSNNITILDEPNYVGSYIWSSDRYGIFCNTGDYTDINKQSDKIYIEDNSIKCNHKESCVGICITSVKDFKIINNLIEEPNNYGILYYSNTSYVNQNFGNSSIIANSINYKNQMKSDLKSRFYYPIYDFAGINITRRTDSTYTNEKFFLNKNIILKNDDNIFFVIFDPDPDQSLIDNNYDIRDKITLNNETILIDTTKEYYAEELIRVSDNGSIFTIKGNGSIGGKVKMKAGKSITLKSSFNVELGGYFSASIYDESDINDPLSNNYLPITELFSQDYLKINKSDGTSLPLKFRLLQNYPNPFNPTTTINYALKEDVNVKIIIYNILGQEVKTLINGKQTAGYKSVVWNGTNQNGSSISSGMYIYKIIAGDFVKVRKMILIR